MKIIKAGNINKVNKTRQFTCPECGCIFEADKDEYVFSMDVYGQPDGYYVTCPYCNSHYTEEF